MDDNSYKISLGVDVDLSNIQSQINTEANKIKPKIKLDVDSADLAKKLKTELQKALKNSDNALKLDTTSLETSLRDVKTIVADIKTSLGTLDSGAGMKSLLSSVNQISTALDKASGKFDELNAELKTLSSKDFSINLGVNMGGANPIGRNTAYGNKVRNETLPQLKQQMSDLVKYYNTTYKQSLNEFEALQKIVSGTKLSNGDFFENFLFGKDSVATRMNSGSLASQMQAYKQYIDMFKQAASLKGLDLSSVTAGFSKTADDLIKDAQDIQTGAKEMEDGFEKLKQVFGGGNNLNVEGIAAQLDSIVADLGEIKITLQSLSSGVSLDGLTQSFDKLSNSIELLVKNCGNMKSAINDSVGGLSGSVGQSGSGIKNATNDLKQVTVAAGNTSDAIQSIQSEMSSMKFDRSSINAVAKDLEEIGVAINKVSVKDNSSHLDVTVKGVDSVGRAVTEIRRLDKATGQISPVSKTISQSFDDGVQAAKRFKEEAETIRGIKFDIAVGKFDEDISKMDDKFNKLSSASDELRESVEQVHKAYAQMELALEGTGDEVADRERLIQAEKEYAAALEKTNNLLRIQFRAEKADADKQRLVDDRQVFQSKIDAWLTKNSAATKKFGAAMLDLKAKAENCDRVELNHLIKEFTKLDNAADKAGLKMQGTFDRVKTKFKEYMAYFSVAEMFMYVEQALREMFNTVLEIDTAMTGLYRVTDLTASQYDALFDDMTASAKEYGATLTDIINATTDWVRAGFDADTALGLAEVTTMYQHISDLDYDTAAENLITAYNGFKEELNGAFDGDQVAAVEYIADIFNQLDNEFAVTSAGLGDALTRSASALDLAGNTIQETAGMVTGIVEVTQDPEKAGSALKILSLRLRGMKGELEELGEETDENVENISKMQGQILNMTGGKVNIFDASGNFKSTYEIMKGVAEVWDSLSSTDQADLLETIAGKHRANDVAALLSNWQNVEAAVKSASEAEGSAARENAKYVDSLQGRLDKLTTAWQSFANTFMESDFLKGAISGLTGLVEVIEKLVDSLGSFGTIGLGVGIFKMFKHKSGVSFILQELSTFGSLVSDVWKSGGKLTARFKDIGAAASVAGGDIAGKLTGSLSGMIGGIGLAVAAISLIVNAIKKYKEEQAQLRQETIESSNAFLDASKSFEKAYIKYSGKTDLTAEEETELASAINGTVDALDDKSSALQNVVNSSNDYLASLEAIKDAELEAAKIAADKKLIAATEEVKRSVDPNFAEWLDGDSSGVNITVARTGLVNKTDAIEELSEAEKIVYDNAKEYFELLEANRASKYWGLELPSDASVETIVDYYHKLINAQNDLVEAGFGETEEYKALDKVIKGMSSSIEIYETAVGEAVKLQYQLNEGVPKTVDEYLKIRESILGDDDVKDLTINTKLSLVNSLDSEYGQIFDLSSAEAQARKFVGLIKGYGEGTKDGTDEIGTVETLLNLRTAVNNNECTVGDYLAQFDEINQMTSNWSDEEKKLFNTSIGIDSDAIKSQYDEVVEYVSREYLDKLDTTGLTGFERSEYKNQERQRIRELLDDLSASELTAVFNLKGEIDWQNLSKEQILEQIEEEAKLIEAISFSINLEVETEKLENLSSAITESLSGAGLSTQSISLVEDMFGDLDSYDQSKLFEDTANGIRLNSEELRKLNDEYKKNNVDKFDDKMDALAERYNQAKEELYNLTYGTKEYNSKLSEVRNIEDQINATEKLASQYKGLVSAYQSWQRTESAGSQRDMYESMIKGFENVDDEMSRGWLDDGTIEFLRLIKGDTLSAVATTKELMAAYKSLDDTIQHTTYSVRDFFTVDEDGNSTNTGVYNFLDAIGQLEEEKFGGKDIVKRGSDGNIIAFDFQIAGGDKAIADALGISEELVQIMVRAADDAGFVVSMDGTFQQLDALKEKAAEAAKTLKETFGITNHNFFADGSEEGILNDYNEALKIWGTFKNNKNEDGTIDMTVEGAEEAYTLVSTLQSMVDKLSEPVYMELDSSQVEKDMQKPLEKLQEYETLIQTEHQLQLKGTDTSQIEADKEEILDYFKELQENSPEIAAELGIKGLTREEIETKIEAGEIKIPATIDLQVEMNSTLRDMVNVALYNAGIIDKEELEKRVDIKVYADKVDASDVEEKTEDAVEDIGDDKDKRKTNVEIIAKTFGVEDVEELSSELKCLDDKTIQAIAEVVGQIDVDKLKQTIATLEPKKVEAIVEAMGEGDVNALKTAIGQLEPKQVQAIAEALGYSDVNELNTAIDNMDGNVVKAVAQALGLDDVNGLQYAIDNMNGNTVDAKVNTDGQSDKINELQGDIDGLHGTTVDVVINAVKKGFNNASAAGSKAVKKRFGSGVGDVNGTAHVDGTTGRAFRQGSWGTKNSGTALVGELGAETLVRDGRYYTIGNNGAEFIKYRRGDIIFNHKQTEELFANGKVTSGGGRGKAFVDGTAFSRGTGGIGKVIEAVAIDGSKSKSKSKPKLKTTVKEKDDSVTVNVSGDGSTGQDGIGEVGGTSVGSGTSNKDKFEETFDWIEVAISRIERAISNLDQKANNIYKSWSERNGALKSQIGEVRSEIELQQKAYNRYIQEANSVGLSSSWAKKVQNGEIDIDTITNESLAEKIKEYETWYEKALDCQDAIEELKETEASLYAQRVENVSAQYEGILGVIEHEKNMLDEYIAQSEANAQLVSGEYYTALADNERENLAKLEQEKTAMLAEFETAMASGKIDKNSEAYYDMVRAIDEVTLAIAESETALLEYEQTIQQLSWERFDLLQEKISAVTEEANFLVELMSSDKLFDDKGGLTDEGKATMGLHGQNYNSYMYQADLVAEEAERLRKELEQDPYDTELEARYREMIALQQEYILSAQQEKEAIRDLVEEGISLELDALQELIDKKNEALESERDLYEYQKKVKEQTEEIASLEKQMAAYSGDDSEEARQKIQQIKVELEEARQNLQETEYDKYISDQQQILDNLYLEYEEILNMRLDNIDALIADMIEQINADASVIGDTIRETADSVGYTLSDSMQTIWDASTTDTTNVITAYGEKFISAQTTTNNALSTINTNLQNMIAQLNKLADTKVKSASISSADNSKEANASEPKKETTKEDKKDNTATIKVGGKINAGNAKIYDYAGDKSGERQYYRKDPIYTVLDEKNGYLKVRWHKLSSGTTGWFKKGDVKALATGARRIDADDVAWTQEKGREFIVRPSDGAILTPVAKGDSVLNATASSNIWKMSNSPAEFIKDNLNFGTTNIPDNSSVNNNYTQYLDKVVFNLPNVHSYEELLHAMQKDKNFERLVTSFTIDKIAGKNSLAKGKSIR